MSVTYESNVARIKNNQMNGTSMVMRLFLEDVHSYSTPVTPRKDGDLRAMVTKTIEPNRGVIEWKAPYAVFQEYPRMKFKYTTAGTGGHFAENAVQMAMMKLPELYDSVMRGYSL